MTRLVVALVRLVVWVIVTATWAFVAFVFWIPFLARMIAQYTGAVLIATYTSGSAAPAEDGLKRSIEFYPEGFRTITRILSGPDSGSRGGNGAGSIWNRHGLTLNDVVKFLLQSVFAAAFWVGAVVLVARYTNLLSDTRVGRWTRSESSTSRAAAQDSVGGDSLKNPNGLPARKPRDNAAANGVRRRQ